MKTVLLSVALVLSSGLTANAAVDMQYLQGLGDSRYHAVESETIGRRFHVYVMLPDGYDDAPDRSYPTVYLLDGGTLFPLLTAYYRYLRFGDEIAEAIIVGISYGSDTFEGGNYRSSDYTARSAERDYWGGAGKFQGFLSDELMPLIEKNYRSRADRRIVFGQSIGGQFVLYTALTQPNLFWGHIASNPALHRNLSFFLEIHSEPVTGGDRPRLFVGSGALDDLRFRQPARQWIEHWSGNEERPFQLKTMILEGHSHMSTPPAAFRQGMTWLFSAE